MEQRECCMECVVEDFTCKDCDTAFEMAIKALEQQTCEDAVSREDALMALTGEWTESTDELIHRFIRRIKNLPPVNPQPKTRWIPVSERLPEIHNYSENYFVTLERGGVYIAMFTECDGKHWWTYDDVIAWMPLSEPYDPQESEG